MEQTNETIDAAKRVKQLENQNLKLRSLLQAAADISNQDLIATARLRTENNDLTKTISNLEEEKRRLESELTEILHKNESGMNKALRRLEQEQLELQNEIEKVLKGVNKEQTEILKLETEDLELRSALIKLEQEKCSLIEKIKRVEQKKDILAQMSIKENPKDRSNEVVSTTSNLVEQQQQKNVTNRAESDENILQTFKQLEQTYKEYMDVLDGKTLENKISELVNKNEQLINEIQVTEEGQVKQSQIKLNETILSSNTNILNKIKEVKSKLANSIDKNYTMLSSLNEDKLMSIRVSEMEKERDLIYEDLEEYLENSSKDIRVLFENLHDPDIRRLVHEIEIQKAVLLYNLKMLKIKDVETTSNTSTHLIAPPSSPAMLISKSKELKHLYTNESETCGKTSSIDASVKNEPQCLEETLARLETERKVLLKQLQSMSESKTFEMSFTTDHAPSLQNNLDDATNQLYTEHELRLEQRIRELEIENSQIKNKLQILADSVGEYKLPGNLLKEKIQELEKNSSSQSEIEE